MRGPEAQDRANQSTEDRPMRRSTSAARFFTITVLLGGLHAFAAVCTAEPPPIAIFNAERGLLQWTPLVDSQSMVLALADPAGVVRTLRFAPGETATLSPFDANGSPLPDGTYTWEIRLTRRLGARLERAIEEARLRGDESALARLDRLSAPLVQSGHFTLAGGSVVAPDLTEPPERVASDRKSSPRGSPPSGVATAADQLVPDDLIVDGKGCIGLGCANNEAFGPEAL